MSKKLHKYTLLSLFAALALSSCEISFGQSINSTSTSSSSPISSTIIQSGSESVLDTPSDWYVIGSFTNWNVIDTYMLTQNYETTYDYSYHIQLSLHTGDKFQAYKNSENPITLGFDTLGGNTIIGDYERDTENSGVMITNDDEYDIYVNVSGNTTFLEIISDSSEPYIDVNFSAINDFHGAINRDSSTNSVGISYLASYLKERKSEGNVLISSGDMWQGTFESNFNNGKLVTEAFKNIGFDAMVLGNHEFDWGASAIFENQNLAEKTYLGANIYNYDDNNTPCYGEKAILGGNYTTKTLHKGTTNEIKIGIIGVIGKDQLSSIQSNLVSDYVFIDPTDTVKLLSTQLRNEYNCDIVVASYHADEDNVDKSIVGGDIGTGTKYVDAVFCAHSHQREISYVNSVPFIQSGSNGRYVGEVSLRYNKESNSVSTLSCNNVDLFSKTLYQDSEVSQIVSRYNSASSATGSQVLGRISDTFDHTSTLPNAIAKGMYDAAVSRGIDDIDYAITNIARNDIVAGEVTYANLYTAVPFDNSIVICEVSGKDIYNEIVSYKNYFYRATNRKLENKSTTTYKVAVCSYLAYHVRIDADTYKKTLNYFASIQNDYDLEYSSGVIYTYRQALVDIFENASGTIDPSTFLGDRYNSSLLTSTL